MTDEDDLFTGRISPDFINLSVGAPGPDGLKKSAEIFASAAQHRIQKTEQTGNVSLFQYGPKCGPAEYLQQLAKFLSGEYGEYGDQVCPRNWSFFYLRLPIATFSFRLSMSMFNIG